MNSYQPLSDPDRFKINSWSNTSTWVFLFIIILVETRKLRVSSKNRTAGKFCLFYPARAG